MKSMSIFACPFLVVELSLHHVFCALGKTSVKKVTRAGIPLYTDKGGKPTDGAMRGDMVVCKPNGEPDV